MGASFGTGTRVDEDGEVGAMILFIRGVGRGIRALGITRRRRDGAGEKPRMPSVGIMPHRGFFANEAHGALRVLHGRFVFLAIFAAGDAVF